jgi:integrase
MKQHPLLPQCFPEAVNMKLKLDAKTVAGLALRAGKSEEFCWDAELEGYGLRLRRRSDGGLLRTWITQYRANGHTRRVTIGSADKLTPVQAREAAGKLLARVTLGHDPQAEKKAKRQQAAHTVRSLVSTYLDVKQSELRPTSLRITKLYLTGPYFRPLHALAVTAVTRTDVATCIRTIARKHSVPTAAAARRALSAFFAWAIAEGEMGDAANPVEGSHRPADPTPRDRVLADTELVAIWNACGDDEYGRIIRLLTLLGSRRQEIGGMCWSELDLDAGTWTLPAERSKNHRPHTITLSAPALEIIKSVPRRNRDHLFGGWAGDGFTSWSRGKQELDQRLARAGRPWRVHDIRRTVATGMADIGIEPHHIEAALNHYSGHRRGVAGIYNRSTYERAVRAALARWGEHALALIEGRKSKIVALPERA